VKYHNSQCYVKQRPTLHFKGSGLVVKDDPDNKATIIALEPNLRSLAAHDGLGFLVRNRLNHIIATRTLKEGDGILILHPEGDNDPSIGISPKYKGQESINTLGKVATGEWEAGIIAPEFGGTGCENEHVISIGGSLITSCLLIIGDSKEKTSSITIDAQGDTEITLPTTGTLATEEESLQSRHNLGDLGNPTEAFRNISPTKERGDLIAHGYGSYSVRVPIGEPGQTLVVDPTTPSGMKWETRDTKEQINQLVKKHVKRHLTAQDVAPKEDCHQVAGMPVEQVVEAILMQLDFMHRSGAMSPLKELRQVLEQWGKSKHKK
jgi:hypothetical protein